MLRFAGDDAIDFIVDVHLIHEVLSDVVQKLMQICVVVIDVTSIRCMVVVLLQDGEGDTAVDAQGVDRNEALVARLLLNYRELPVTEVLWADAYQVGVSLTEVAAKHEHISHTF